MSGPDRRSVGELLLDADQTARDVLLDVGDLDAAAMLRTWGEAVQTAAELWAALPTTPTPGAEQQGQAPADAMAQVSAMTAALGRGLRHRTWPGAGATDPRLQAIADSFAGATELIHRHARPGGSGDPAVRADADAARARIIHTLYLASHGVRLTLIAEQGRLEKAPRGRGWAAVARNLSAVRSVLPRLGAMEQVAGGYVVRTFPAALAGEHREPPAGSRVADALAAWDVQAHRALVAHPSAGHLRLVARTQELLLGHAAVILSAAAQAGAIDRYQYATRLEQPLEVARSVWAATGRSWAQFAQHGARPDATVLTVAAGEVRAALREITINGSTSAPAADIASRTDLSATARTLATVLFTSTDLAHLVRDVTLDPRVTFPARAVNAAAVAASTTPSGGTVPGSGEAAQVAIKDLTANRDIPLTTEVRTREGLRAQHLVVASGAAADAAAWLPSPAPAATRQEPVIRAAHGRPLQPVGRSVAGRGCER